MTRSDAEIGGRKSPLSWVIRLGSASATAALLLAGSGAKADVIETFDLSGSFLFPMSPTRTFTGTIDFDFPDGTANSVTLKSVDITVDGLPAYDQSPSLGFGRSVYQAVVNAYDNSGDLLTLTFTIPYLQTLASFDEGRIVDGLAVYGGGTGNLLTATGNITLDPATPGPITAATVPEASTWAMMLLGFAGLGLGAAARQARRKRRAFGAEAPIRVRCLRG
jgi:hypothetical protein